MRSDLRFFIDRGVGSFVVPNGLRDAGWSVVTMDERYGLQESQASPIRCGSPTLQRATKF